MRVLPSQVDPELVHVIPRGRAAMKGETMYEKVLELREMMNIHARLLDWLGDRLQDWGYALKLRDWWRS